MASDGLEWEKLIDGLRPLGEAMRRRVPERLRGDPQAMAESMRLLLAGVTRATADALVGNRRHPLFVPELNIAQNIFQPNADTIYKACLIEKGGTYVIKGDRGTVRMVILAQMGPDTLRTGQHHPLLGQVDFDSLTLDANGHFELVMSPERPAGYAGDWRQLDPLCEKFMIRVVGCDWGVEREPRFGIARLDVDEAKGRPSAETLHHAFGEIPGIVGVCALAFLARAEWGQPGLDQYLGHIEAWYHGCRKDRVMPTVDAAIAYIRSHEPKDTPVNVLWGDSTPSNVMFRPDGSVSGLIDWELAAMGPSELDLAWWLYFDDLFSRRFGVARLEGLPTRDESIAIWEAAVGRKAQHLDYYDVVVALRMALVVVGAFADLDIPRNPLPNFVSECPIGKDVSA